MKENILKTKTFTFSIKIVDCYKLLIQEKKEYVLSKQLLRSGTSVGAMIRESEHAESKLDFIHKMAIAQKEINESIYWLELLHATKFLSTELFNSLNNDADEIIKLITTSIKTSKANINH
ncbi:MAG: four helix bundle protein [Bacteroidetes bacterium]|nr:four helix bundle protein [Bacteroidota bacterium]